MKKIILSTIIVCFTFVVSLAETKGKWKPLFGKDLANARYDADVWSVKNGVLSAIKDRSIWTKSEYENFELDLRFKTDVATNSGVIIYCTNTKKWTKNSVEIQIADDYSEKIENWPPNYKCGAIFGHLGAKRDKVVKKPGKWNRMTILCIGQNITVTLNGEEVAHMDMSLWTSGEINPDGTKIPKHLHQPKTFSEFPTKGYIGLQGKHGKALIWFKKVRIRQVEVSSKS